MKGTRHLACVMALPLLGAALTVLLAAGDVHAQAGGYTKAVVGDTIRKVEDGVDEFRKYLDNRGETVKDNAQAAQNSGARRAPANTANTQTRKDAANRTKDELDDAMGDLNGSTNRLRRKFDPTSNYMETRSQMEKVMEDARRVNQVMVRGHYGTQAERLWAPLRKSINDLARCYGLSPMAA
jgi:hypothetical protein